MSNAGLFIGSSIQENYSHGELHFLEFRIERPCLAANHVQHKDTDIAALWRGVD